MNIKRMRKEEELMKLYLDQQKFETALGLARRIMPVYEFLYPSYWPLLGLQYYLLGKLENFIGDVKRSQEYLLKAINCLEPLFSHSSQFIQQLKSLSQEVSFLNQH
eukprot:TRINITY_DN8047_c0_g1_i1.p1 TRINITY_DN8047_c0_g1~~TRINITY_DN8047_c0_g1_i1.p1  ORF type:complete len:120 (+),score=30.02 TRINITY_DN8047_c0_g1_i1:43-360(+)